MTEEKKVQSKLLHFLNINKPNCYAIKTISTNKNGVPDIIACILGHFVAFECKGLTNKTTKLQEFNLTEIERARGTTFVVDPKNLQLVIQGIKLFILTHKNNNKGIKIK